MKKFDNSARFIQNIFSLKSITRRPQSILIFIALFLLMLAVETFPQAARISMDGYFSDWTQLKPLYGGSLKKQSVNSQFFGKLWAANDERFLFFRLEVGTEINLQNNNRIVLYLDTDNRAETGRQIHGIGAELEWHFGDRSGTFFNGGKSYAIGYHQIGLVTMPTVSSREFEMALMREARPANDQPLFVADTIAIVFEEQTNGELVPVGGNKIYYAFDPATLPPITPISLQKQSPEQVRVLTYNVLRDNFFSANRRENFERILRAIQPDIIGFEEIYDHSADQTAQQVESILPSAPGNSWYRSKIDPDIVAISRFPITKSFPIDGNGAFLIQLTPRYDRDLLLIVAHPPSGSRNYERQQEIDAIMAFVREAKQPGGMLQLPPNTPILIIGDMNLVGYAEQLRTFLTGEIYNVGQYGPSFKPDWDGTDFTALLPRQTDLLMSYTWYDENNSFSPGWLDYMIYSDSVIKPGNRFILFTPEMSPDSLARYGLQANDVIRASDHLPVVADFIVPLTTSIKSSAAPSFPGSFSLNQNYPNPFNPATQISYYLPSRSRVALKIFNLQGQEIFTLVDSIQAGGYQSVTWQGQDQSGNRVTSGVYIYQLQVKDQIETKKMLLLR